MRQMFKDWKSDATQSYVEGGYVEGFLRDFTMWEDGDIHTFLRFNGFTTLDDIPCLFDLQLSMNRE